MKYAIASIVLLVSTPVLAAQVQVVESYNAAVGELPEGVAVAPNGDIYVTLAGTGEIRRIDRKTKVGSTHAWLNPGSGFLLGMAFDGDDLYAALGSFDPATSGIWRVDDDGSTVRVVAFGGDQFPNDLTFDEDGNMYVTESISGSVYKVEAGSSVPQLWVQDQLLVGDPQVSPVPFPIGVNGIAYDEETGTVLVTNSQVPALIEIEDNCGQAGVLSVIAAGEHLRGADGIAIDKKGDVMLVSNFHSSVLRIDRDSGVATTIADGSDGLMFPSTAAFGQYGPDKKSLFVVNFGFGAGPNAPVGLLKIEVGQKSSKHPAGN
ncbi:SMP-30/gluconolactonase/LRE family protein [Enhygromyxa salina]|uniref:SMP-30/gluconolactonase/LRE family protein n=1 Tax=Enhygromyxa salina TaxID=215803 RepID=UPI0011BAA1A8|nr:SMP-30/gluconolactonase/LRE family protein [Enhygromyxa salina]